MMPYFAALLLVLGWLTTEHFPPWISWHSELTVFLAVVLLSAWGLWRMRRRAGGGGVVKLPALGGALIAFLVLIAVQTMAAQIKFVGDGLVLGLYVAMSLAALTLGFASIRRDSGAGSIKGEPETLMLIAATLLAGAVLSSFVALVQVLDVWEASSWVVRMPMLSRAGGNLTQPNHLATLLLMGLVSLLFLLEKNKLGPWSAALIFVVLGMAMASAQSRTSLLSLTGLVIWWVAGKQRFALRQHAWFVFAAAGILIATFWAWPQFMVSIGMAELGAQVDTSAGMRLVVWPQLVEAVLLQPWFGWGLREVSAAHNAVAHAYPVSELYSYGHNIVLDMALGMGLPLTALVVGASGLGLWRRLKAVHTLNAWYCLAAVLPVAVHSMLEFPYAYSYFLAPVMFMLGRLDAELKISPLWQVKQNWATLAFLGTLALGVATVPEYIKIEEDFRIVRLEARHLGQTPSEYQRPKIHLLTQMDALITAARIVPKPNMTSEDLELLHKVALRHPVPATQYRYALSLALNGNPDEAVRQLKVQRAVLGQKTYEGVKGSWENLGKEKYPQLKEIKLP